MLWWIAFVLGFVQGLGEFLPVSSSAHLILVRWGFGWEEIIQNTGPNAGIALDVALHVGTLVAVLIYFFREWVQIISGGLMHEMKTRDDRMFWYLVAATVPGALAGLFLEDVIERLFRSSPLIIAASLAVMGILLYLSDMLCSQQIRFERIGFKQAFLLDVPKHWP